MNQTIVLAAAQLFASRRRIAVMGAPIDVLSWDDVIAMIAQLARWRRSSYVCICNVHSVVTASGEPEFLQVLAEADLVTPDGAPVAWMLRRMGAICQARISGPDLFTAYCEHAAAIGESIFLYGGTPQTLKALERQLVERFPSLRIAGAISPPFRELSAEEDEEIVRAINESGASTVWVGLGCPKQERWMAAHRGRVQAVMIGVGAAFEFHAGTMSRAPLWMRDSGLEWLHRLVCEPGRLWRRYLTTNTAFIVGAIQQLMRRPAKS